MKIKNRWYLSNQINKLIFSTMFIMEIDSILNFLFSSLINDSNTRNDLNRTFKIHQINQHQYEQIIIVISISFVLFILHYRFILILYWTLIALKFIEYKVSFLVKGSSGSECKSNLYAVGQFGGSLSTALFCNTTKKIISMFIHFNLQLKSKSLFNSFNYATILF